MSRENLDQSQPEEGMSWEQFTVAGRTITWDEFLARTESIAGRDLSFRGPFGGLWQGPIKKCVLNEMGWELVLDWVAEREKGKDTWLLVPPTMPFGLVGFKNMTEFGDVEGVIRLRFLDTPALHYLQEEGKVVMIHYKLGTNEIIKAECGDFAMILTDGNNLPRPSKLVKVPQLLQSIKKRRRRR